MSTVQQIKVVIVEHVDLAKDALHVYVALIVFLGACWLFRMRPSSVVPWLIVLAVALIGEIWDIRDTLADDDPVRLANNWKDIWNTMLAPTMIVLVARFTSVFSRNEGVADLPGDNNQESPAQETPADK